MEGEGEGRTGPAVVEEEDVGGAAAQTQRHRGGSEESGNETDVDKTLASLAVWPDKGQNRGNPKTKRQKATLKNKKRALSSQLGLPTATIESGANLPCCRPRDAQEHADLARPSSDGGMAARARMCLHAIGSRTLLRSSRASKQTADGPRRLLPTLHPPTAVRSTKDSQPFQQGKHQAGWSLLLHLRAADGWLAPAPGYSLPPRT